MNDYYVRRSSCNNKKTDVLSLFKNISPKNHSHEKSYDHRRYNATKLNVSK